MKFLTRNNPLSKSPLIVKIVVAIAAGAVSFFFLLFGLAHVFEGTKQIIEGSTPDIPRSEAMLGWLTVTMFCIIGGMALVITLAAIKAILSKKEHNDNL